MSAKALGPPGRDHPLPIDRSEIFADQNGRGIEDFLLRSGTEFQPLGQLPALGAAFRVRGAGKSVEGCDDGPVFFRHPRKLGLQPLREPDENGRIGSRPAGNELGERAERRENQFFFGTKVRPQQTSRLFGSRSRASPQGNGVGKVPVQRIVLGLERFGNRHDYP